MRAVDRRVPSGADVTDHVAVFDFQSLSQAVRITIQVRIGKAVNAFRVVLVNGDAAAGAGGELADHSVAERMNGSAARSGNINRFVRLSPGPRPRKSILQRIP